MSSTNPLQFTAELARIASDNKCDDVVAFDLRGISAVMDFTVIATGTSERQIRAVADRVVEYGRKVGERPFGLCGADGASWVVIDYVDVVVHIFNVSARTYYDLELLWGDAPRVEWSRSASA